MLGRSVNNAGAENFSQAQRFDALFPSARNLDECQLALQRAALQRQVVDVVDGNQPLELMLYLLDNVRCATRDDGDARKVLLMLGLRHGQRVDVVAASGKQSDDARQHTWFVVDEHGQRARDNLLRGAGADIVALWNALGGGIDHRRDYSCF